MKLRTISCSFIFIRQALLPLGLGVNGLRLFEAKWNNDESKNDGVCHNHLSTQIFINVVDNFYNARLWEIGWDYEKLVENMRK